MGVAEGSDNCFPVNRLKITRRVRWKNLISFQLLTLNLNNFFVFETNAAACSVRHVLKASMKVDRRVRGEPPSTSSRAGKRARIEECANEDIRFPSWLKPSRTINCLPKISAPTPGRQATVYTPTHPAAPPLPLVRVLVQTHAHAHILTRVPVSALSKYEELKNVWLVFGSVGISSLLLNHWY